MAKTPAVTISGSKRPAAGVAAASLPEAPSIGNMLGTIALAIGVGVLGYYALDGHSHTCEACGHRWRHLGVLNLGDPVAHSCARCGTVQWWKDGVPHVFREALRSPPSKVLPDTIVSRLREIREAPRMALASGTSLTPRDQTRQDPSWSRLDQRRAGFMPEAAIDASASSNRSETSRGSLRNKESKP